MTALLQKLKVDELDFGEETGEALEEADLGKKSNWNVNAFKLLKFKAFYFFNSGGLTESFVKGLYVNLQKNKKSLLHSSK